MFYGFRLNDAKEWTKMKTFNTVEEYKEYVEKRRISFAKLIDEKTYQKYYVNQGSTELDDDE